MISPLWQVPPGSTMETGAESGRGTAKAETEWWEAVKGENVAGAGTNPIPSGLPTSPVI